MLWIEKGRRRTDARLEAAWMLFGREVSDDDNENRAAGDGGVSGGVCFSSVRLAKVTAGADESPFVRTAKCATDIGIQSSGTDCDTPLEGHTGRGSLRLSRRSADEHHAAVGSYAWAARWWSPLGAVRAQLERTTMESGEGMTHLRQNITATVGLRGRVPGDCGGDPGADAGRHHRKPARGCRTPS